MHTQPWTVVYGRPTSTFQSEVQNQIRVNVLLVLVTLLLILIISTLISRSLANPITELAKTADAISQGDLNARAQVRSRDEIGMLARAFNSMTSQLQETLGSLEQRVLERTGVVETARAEAEAARAEAEAARKDIEAQVWLATGQTQLADVMRGEQDILQLGENVISQLCRYMDAQAGALFVLKEKTLVLVGRYAFSMRPDFDGNLELGEGLVGQAALDGKTHILEDIPSDAPVISTGLVDFKPREVIAIPFYANGVVAGVIELATLKEFEPSHFELLRRVSENIGVAFRTAETRYRLAELLAESQSQAEELQAQGEELRAANEELHAQAETLKAIRKLQE
jgi:HAMP domain-containing protein/putative methionine-R-sulfoxide reductase with GAF domain